MLQPHSANHIRHHMGQLMTMPCVYFPLFHPIQGFDLRLNLNAASERARGKFPTKVGRVRSYWFETVRRFKH